jgi:hypothetical protein
MKSQTTINNQTGQQLLTDTQTDPYPQIAIYSIQDFLKWWYVKMLIWHLRKFKRVIIVVDDQLSISLLAKNFFVPWHRDRSAIGYVFGIVMKIIYLPIALTIFLLTMGIYLGIIGIWLILPIGTLVFIITSIIT